MKDTIPHITDLPPGAVEERKNRTELKALIIDDQAFSRKMVEMGLDKEMEVVTADDGRAGVGLYALHNPNIVFLDIGLPGINGHNTLKKIAQLDPEAYVVVVSASSDEADINTARENGAKDYLVKPVDKNAITAVLAAYKQSCLAR